MGLFSCKNIFLVYNGGMSREKFPVMPQESSEDEGREHNPTPEEIELALKMSGEKGVKRVITAEDRAREKEAADKALEAARRKIIGETKGGQRELFRE